jgi:hypothetical protein
MFNINLLVVEHIIICQPVVLQPVPLGTGLCVLYI